MRRGVFWKWRAPRSARSSLLGGLAEFERDLIRARTGEGRARAVANGVKLGRKPKLTPHQRQEGLVVTDMPKVPI